MPPFFRHTRTSLTDPLQIDLVSVLSDSMYSDSHVAIDALAQLIEAHVQMPEDEMVSVGRMKQLRHILELDEATFMSRFDANHLRTIEQREMSEIVDELVSASRSSFMSLSLRCFGGIFEDIQKRQFQENSEEFYLLLLKELFGAIKDFKAVGINLEDLVSTNILLEKKEESLKVKILYD